jgi:hypothetical protein
VRCDEDLGKAHHPVRCNPVLLQDLLGFKVALSIHQEDGVFSFMTNKAQSRPVPVPKDLQRTFESAVRDIHQVSLTGQASPQRTPIVQRVGAGARESYISAEKRALSDAAKALAQLWRVSPSSTR